MNKKIIFKWDREMIKSKNICLLSKQYKNLKMLRVLNKLK